MRKVLNWTLNFSLQPCKVNYIFIPCRNRTKHLLVEARFPAIRRRGHKLSRLGAKKEVLVLCQLSYLTLFRDKSGDRTHITRLQVDNLFLSASYLTPTGIEPVLLNFTPTSQLNWLKTFLIQRALPPTPLALLKKRDLRKSFVQQTCICPLSHWVSNKVIGGNSQHRLYV